jgi:hypothetical protein
MKRKTITLNSPAGSGNMFCEYLMLYNLEFDLRWVQHNENLFDKDGLNLYILRNPYQTVSSGIEIHFNSLSKNIQDLILKNADYNINQWIDGYVRIYDKFLDNAKNFEYITTVDFEFLTKEPYQFLNDISKKFDIPFKKNKLSVEGVKYKMKNEAGLEHRLPREHSEFRNRINQAVNNNLKLKNSYNKYIEYKNLIDLEYLEKGLK